MNKLTAEVARRDISHLKAFQKQPNIGLSLREETYLQALEIALPILEQQERGSIIAEQLEAVRESLELNPHQNAIISCAIDRINLLTARTLELSRSLIKQQERGLSIPDGYRLVPEKLTDEMLRRIIPNMAHSLPISHDEYDYYGRNERFVKWVWARLLKLSEAATPEQPTNQNGEQ